MKEIHMAQIGELFTLDDISLLSNQNLLEYDFLIIDMAELTSSLNNGIPSMITTRISDLQEFIKHKNIPLVFICNDDAEYRALIGNSENFWNKLGLEVEEIDSAGKKIEYNNVSLFSELLTKHIDCFEYEVCFAQHLGTSLGTAKSKPYSIGFYDRQVVALPALAEDYYFADEQAFLYELYEICRKVRKDDHVLQVPQWTAKYMLPKEKDEQEQLAEIESKIAELELQKAESVLRLSNFQPLKLLWTSSGGTLEKAAAEVFRELGLSILLSEQGRDDILMEYNGQTIVAEVKGLTKTAGEGNAGQLEKWVSIHLADTGKIPKGILIVNTFRNIELAERKEAPFPPQMIPYSLKREHCLVTTLQLCNLLLYCRAHPEQKEDIVQKLLGTIGVFEDFSNWRKWIDGPPAKLQTAKRKAKSKE